MAKITEDIVQATWKEVARLEEAETRADITSLGQQQPDLLAFLSTYFRDLSPQARELGLYLFYVVHRMFGRAGLQVPQRISAEHVFDIYDRNKTLLKRLEGAHALFYDRVAKAHQPYVMSYVLGALVKFGEAPGETSLSENETATLFLVLKTAVDALDAAVPRVDEGD